MPLDGEAGHGFFQPGTRVKLNTTRPGPDVISLKVTDQFGQAATASIEVQVVETKLYQSGPKPTR